ncbi:MAG: hypothetical protein ACOYUB_01010 [Patescibacteria group bacterium]
MRKYILVICLAFLLSRLVFLDQFFLSRDERDLSLTGYSIAKTGKDLFGNNMPVSFERISPNAPFAAVYYDALWWLTPLAKNVFNARLAFVLPASLLPFLVYELIYILSKQRRYALATSIIFSFSPWVFHISRMALEVNLALPLLLAGVILQLKGRRWLSIIFYGLAFFTYQGMRPLIGVLPIFLEARNFFAAKIELKKTLNSIFLFLGFFVLALVASVLMERGIRARSINEIVFFNWPKLSKEVQFLRSVSYGPELIKPVFDNKIAKAADYTTVNLLKGLDISYLFKTGDYDEKYANGIAGQFFLATLPFMFLGLIFFKKKPISHYFAAGLMLVGLVPAVINTYSLTFSVRAIVSAIGFSFIIAVGLIDGFTVLAKNRHTAVRLLIYAGFIFFAVFEVSGFYYHYFFSRFGLYSEVFSEADRKVAGHLENGRKYKIVSPLPYQTLMDYVFLTEVSAMDMPGLARTIKGRYDDFSFKGNAFVSCEKMANSRPEDLRMTIMNELCISGEKKPLLEKLKIKTIPYSSYVPYKYETKPAYYIFEN